MNVLVARSCPTLCDSIDCNLPGSSVHEILQAIILGWVAILSPGDLTDPGIEPRSPTLQADSLLSEPTGKPTDILLQPSILKIYSFIFLSFIHLFIIQQTFTEPMF